MKARDQQAGDVLDNFRRECETVGYIKGESAQAFMQRNPSSARVLADFIRDHKAELVQAIAKAHG